MSYAVATSPRRQRLLRFFLVGLSAAAVQTVLLWAFVDIGGLNYLFGAFVAIEITILFQYVLNNAWTFHRSKHTSRREYIIGMGKTNLVRGTAIPLQLGILYALVSATTIEYLIANGMAIAVTGLYRYALDATWTWS
ncbi:GtrA family protein [Haloarcula amylovorans]|uniref:GtrA family protein n=1 Tax=Haloarcula amylovorans TaxID=2562280 RepID=UPI0010768D06|nr:GtrA family protein [Halomicroarcula amylolytica]